MNDHLPLPSQDGDDASYAWLDEWLCEYVDGTMDPSLQATFEKYVEANPELKAHIEQLNETRDLLGQQCAPEPPSPEKRQRVCNRVRSRVCQKVECDMLRSQTSLFALAHDHPSVAIGFASSIAVALVVGVFAGAMLFGPESYPTAVPPASTTAADRGPVPPDPVPAVREASTDPTTDPTTKPTTATSTQAVTPFPVAAPIVPALDPSPRANAVPDPFLQRLDGTLPLISPDVLDGTRPIAPSGPALSSTQQP